jgi:branched-chain amino acid transport system ATP-binding protein
MMGILEVKNLTVEYGAIRAVKGISFSVDKGNIFAILGANGAGKSATLRTISGIVKPKSGEIIFDGKNIVGKSIYSIAKSGISHSPEGRQILSGLTVEENLKVGTYSLTKRGRDRSVNKVEQNQQYV